MLGWEQDDEKVGRMDEEAGRTGKEMGGIRKEDIAGCLTERSGDWDCNWSGEEKESIAENDSHNEAQGGGR